MRLRRELVLATASVAAFGAGLVTHDQVGSSELAGPTATGCVVRFTNSGPAILNDSNHACTGARSVSVLSNGDLMVRSQSRGPVVSVSVDEDETLSSRGVLAGASGARDHTAVRFYSTRTGKQVRADSSVLKGSTSNIWLTWTHTGR